MLLQTNEREPSVGLVKVLSGLSTSVKTGISVSKRAPDVENLLELKEVEIKYQAIRASGPGGQHVNKTDSAVRVTHIPSGVSAVSQDQRSQFANKKIARLKLALIFAEKRELSASKTKEDLWKQNFELERGNEVRTYEGVKFRLRNGLVTV